MGNGIVEILKEIPDYRIGNAKKHRLEEILTVSVLSVLSDCTQFTEIELFGKEQEEWLKTFLKLEHGIPSHDTFGDVFAAIDSEMFRPCFMKWVEEIRQKISGEIVAIDGKTICGSKNIPNSKKAVHIVSAWAAQNGLVWGELAVNDKSNEITAIPALLKMLELSSCIVTIDAMGPQKEIAKEIIESKADYVLVVKENQPGLYDELSLFFSQKRKNATMQKQQKNLMVD